MYKRILLAIDFSEVTDLAAKKTLQLGEFFSAEIHTCFVLRAEDVLTYSAYIYAHDFEFESNILNPLKAKFNDFSDSLNVHEHNRHFLKGNAKLEILRLSKSLKFDLIILGGHDHSRIGMLGSVASIVANKAECDVLIVKKSI